MLKKIRPDDTSARTIASSFFTNMSKIAPDLIFSPIQAEFHKTSLHPLKGLVKVSFANCREPSACDSGMTEKESLTSYVRIEKQVKCKSILLKESRINRPIQDVIS